MMRFPSSTLVPSSRTTSGLSSPSVLRRADHAFGDDVAPHDAAEDVDEDAFDIVVGQDDLEGLGHALGRGAAADVEKIGRRTARSWMMSIVAMARPAPFTMQPILPSSLM